MRLGRFCFAADTITKDPHHFISLMDGNVQKVDLAVLKPSLSPKMDAVGSRRDFVAFDALPIDEFPRIGNAHDAPVGE